MPTIHKKNGKYENKAISAADFFPHDEKEKRILRARSEHLAQIIANKETLKEEIHYICFRLGPRERYGIPYESAKEVIHHFALTKLPQVPAYIAGIINWRGTLTAILDLKKFFNMTHDTIQKNQSIIIVESEGVTTGILTDAIEGSQSYNSTTLEPPLPAGAAINPEYFYGLHTGLIAIINIQTILAEVKSQLSK